MGPKCVYYVGKLSPSAEPNSDPDMLPYSLLIDFGDYKCDSDFDQESIDAWNNLLDGDADFLER